jgi:uncharacterized membrane protein
MHALGWCFELLCLIALAGTVFLVLSNFKLLPDTLPTHYNFAGQPDKFGDKQAILFLPALGLVLYVLLTVLNRYPHIFNYPYNITNENAERQYKNSMTMVQVVKTIILVQITFMTFRKIQIGYGEASSLGTYFVPLFVLLLLIAIVIFLVRGYQLK